MPSYRYGKDPFARLHKEYRKSRRNKARVAFSSSNDSSGSEEIRRLAKPHYTPDSCSSDNSELICQTTKFSPLTPDFKQDQPPAREPPSRESSTREQTAPREMPGRELSAPQPNPATPSYASPATFSCPTNSSSLENPAKASTKESSETFISLKDLRTELAAHRSQTETQKIQALCDEVNNLKLVRSCGCGTAIVELRLEFDMFRRSAESVFNTVNNLQHSNTSLRRRMKNIEAMLWERKGEPPSCANEPPPHARDRRSGCGSQVSHERCASFGNTEYNSEYHERQGAHCISLQPPPSGREFAAHVGESHHTQMRLLPVEVARAYVETHSPGMRAHEMQAPEVAYRSDEGVGVLLDPACRHRGEHLYPQTCSPYSENGRLEQNPNHHHHGSSSTAMNSQCATLATPAVFSNPTPRSTMAMTSSRSSQEVVHEAASGEDLRSRASHAEGSTGSSIAASREMPGVMLSTGELRPDESVRFATGSVELAVAHHSAHPSSVEADQASERTLALRGRLSETEKLIRGIYQRFKSDGNQMPMALKREVTLLTNKRRQLLAALKENFEG